jgi:hypothetical protein
MLNLKADEKIDSLTASINRFWNAVDRAFTQTGQAGLADTFGTIIDGAGSAVAVIGTQTVAIGRMAAAVAAYASGAIKSLSDLEAELQRIQQEAMEQAFGAIPQFDPNAPSGRKQTEQGKSLSEVGPTEKFKEELAKRRMAAKSSTELELEIWRQYSAEKSALAFGDEKAARKAQEAQEAALTQLAKAGASKAMMSTYEDLVGRIESTPITMKATMELKPVGLEQMNAEIRTALEFGIIPLQVRPILDFDQLHWTQEINGQTLDLPRNNGNQLEQEADKTGANP